MLKKKILIICSVLFILQGCYRKEEKSNADTNQTIENVQNEKEEVTNLPQSKVTDWELILINPTHELPNDYEQTVNYQEVDGELMDARIVDKYLAMKAAAKEAGHQLYLGSAYRSVEHQKFNYDWNVNYYLEQGYTMDEAQKKTEEFIAKPGYSEHHAGLALDIVDEEWFASHDDPYLESYDTQPSQQWLVEHSPDYGFILRYPKNKVQETGIGYEPWHFRYVGVENARYIQDNHLSLEKYLELLSRD